jgi:3-deoxy-D-manno-octulosonic-acid transferase
VLILYNLLMTLLAPIWAPWMLVRAARRKEPVIWDERYGIYGFKPDASRPRLWFHAVSVGEVIAAKPILTELKVLRPDICVVLTVTTSSGHRTAREQLSGLYEHIAYMPIDVPRFQLRAMAVVRPHAVAIMETELWLNLLWAAKVLGARTLLVNGRISDKNFRISRHLRFFYRQIFRRMDRVLAQTEGDRKRLEALGATSVQVLGNTKFDQAADSVVADPVAVRAEFGIPDGRKVVVIGSTRSELEEQWVVKALKGIGLQDLAVVHAPRHIERGAALGALVESTFGAVAYRSKGERGEYLILDTYGELAKAYAAADIAVVGGGFDHFGGQNIIQPMALGKPVLHGPNMENFRQAAAEAVAAGASRVCASPEELEAAINELLTDASLRTRMGQAAQALVQASLGAAHRYAEAIIAELNLASK